MRPASWLNHRFARERETSAAEERRRHEQQLAEDSHQKEFLYIATDLIFILEMFVDECANVASDNQFSIKFSHLHEYNEVFTY